MGGFFESLDGDLQSFIADQHVFFTATAPAEGRINLSPKGMDTLRCIDEKTVAYLDVTGSGNETSAHIHENGRMTMMLCSFSNKPMILRLYGRGRVVSKYDEEWNDLIPLFDPKPGTRQIIVLHIESVQTSCGYAVPVMDLKYARHTLEKWARNTGEEALAEYRVKNNVTSIDGLPVPLTDAS